VCLSTLVLMWARLRGCTSSHLHPVRWFAYKPKPFKEVFDTFADRKSKPCPVKLRPLAEDAMIANCWAFSHLLGFVKSGKRMGPYHLIKRPKVIKNSDRFTKKLDIEQKLRYSYTSSAFAVHLCFSEPDMMGSAGAGFLADPTAENLHKLPVLPDFDDFILPLLNWSHEPGAHKAWFMKGKNTWWVIKERLKMLRFCLDHMGVDGYIREGVVLPDYSSKNKTAAQKGKKDEQKIG